MTDFLAVAATELDRSPLRGARIPREQVAGIIAEYKYLAESIASQFGDIYRTFTPEGHHFLFESPDAALQFGFKLIDSWKRRWQAIPEPRETPHMPIRFGCHFGECTQLQADAGWVGTALDLAKPIAAVAEPDSVYVTNNLLDLVDLTLYQFEDAGTRELKGDQLPRRILYKVTAFNQVPSPFRPLEILNAEDWLLKAVALIGTDKENTAEEAEFYRKALSLRADFPEAHNNLGAVLRTLGEGALAAEHYREALRLRPNYPEAHYNYAVLLQLRGSAAGASEHYREALRLRTDYVDAHYGYANLLVAAGELAQAEMHYQEALRIRPEYAEVHNNFAILLEEKGDTKLALKHYQRALRIRPEYPEAHYNFAIALEIDGEFEGAEAEYREALRLRTPYPEAQNNLAILLQTKGDLSGAEEHYREVLRNRPDDPETHYNFGLLLKAKGDITGSEDHFRTAYDLAPPEWFVSFVAEIQPETGQSSSLDSVAFTQRELEVIRLMAVGKSNRDIGQELVISLSTVAHHITNILNKTGASNRTEAVAVAVHHGLVAR